MMTRRKSTAFPTDVTRPSPPPVFEEREPGDEATGIQYMHSARNVRVVLSLYYLYCTLYGSGQLL